MKLLQVPYSFFPDPVGGTEVYVDSLARRLQSEGIHTIVAAPAKENTAYEHDGLPVRRFKTSGSLDLRDLYGEGDPAAAAAFARILDEETPDLIHLHALTSGVSLRLVRAAKQRRIPVVFTYHTPTVSCLRGTLLEQGSDICDGVMDVNRCARCTLHGLGLNRTAASLLGTVPIALGEWLGNCRLSGGFWTAARMTELTDLRHRATRAFWSEVDRIVAVCNWVRDLLIRNGVPKSKITLSRQGLAHPLNSQLSTLNPQLPQGPLRVVFLGRLDPAKGVHILVEAFRRSPNLNATLHIYGIAQGDSRQASFAKLKATAARDSRVEFRQPVRSSEIVGVLRNYDLLAVPSQCLETGPLVVLEAFAAGVPVIGSNLGGIAELVQHGTNGFLVNSHSTDEWAHYFQDLANDPSPLLRFRKVITAPRAIADASDDMLQIYRNLVPHRIVATEA